MKLKDMKRKASDHVSECPMDSEEYPYGLRIMLGNDEIDSLNVDVAGMSAGDEVAVIAKAVIKSVNEREEMMDGKPMVYRDCTLQITELALHQEEKKDNSIKSILKKAMA